jgi:hypothetical protein
MDMRKIVVASLLAFAVTLAAVIGNRLSAEAVAVVVGVVCGVAAGIPTSLLLILLFNRGARRETAEGWSGLGPAGNRVGGYPPVIVIQGGATSPGALPPPYYTSMPTGAEPAQRHFHIVGQHEE